MGLSYLISVVGALVSLYLADFSYFAGAWSENTVGFLSGLWVTMALFIGGALAFFRKLSDIDDTTSLASA